MKKLFLLSFCLGFLSSCFFLFDDLEKENSDKPDDPGEKTFIFFDNALGRTTVSVFNDYNGRNDDKITNKITDVPARQLTGAIEYYPGTSVPFYFSYLIKLKDIYNFSFYFTPPIIGKDQIWVPVYKNKENKVTVPRLEDTLSTPDQLLSKDAYLLIQNDSSFPFWLIQGSSIITPDNLSNYTVTAGEKAIYKISPGSANYKVSENAIDKPLTAPDNGYKAGTLYRYINVNTGVTLDSQKLLNIDLIDDTPSRFPPPNVKAGGISQTEIRITWDAVPGAAGYRVYRGSGAASNYTLINSPTDITHTDTGFSPVSTYYYRVSTLDVNDNESERSNAVIASTLPVPVPSGLYAAPSGSGAIYISWNYVLVATAYNVYRARSSDGPYSLIYTVTSPGYLDSGRTPGYEFFYKVSTVMGPWESVLSSHVSATTQ